jgi:hypothetical protein
MASQHKNAIENVDRCFISRGRRGIIRSSVITPLNESGLGQLFPDTAEFEPIATCRVLQRTITITACIDRVTNGVTGFGTRHIAGNSPVTIVESIVGSLNAGLLIRQIPHPRAGNQFLALEHAAQQEADDHQDHGDLDQRETFLSLLQLHCDSPPGGRLCRGRRIRLAFRLPHRASRAPG